MLRANFEVVLKDGKRYSASHLSVGRRATYNSVGEGVGSISTLSFVCSGEMITEAAADVAEVLWHATGAWYCGECDQSLYSQVGYGIHANPKPLAGSES